MFISQLGEIELIKLIRETCSGVGSESELVGIGDDCAIFPLDETFDGLITTDLLIENVHFTSETVTMWELGAKSVEANVSDIAAMGGDPLYATVSFAINAESQVIAIQSLYKGITDRAGTYNISIIGGDTSRSTGDMFISIALVGKVKKDQALLRSGALHDDLICVTGPLGASFTGLQWLVSGLKESFQSEHADEMFKEALKYCTDKHKQPRSRIRFGQILSSSGFCTSCIDLSDGLANDLMHIVRESKVGATIELNSIPVSPETERLARIMSIDPLHAATAGGEDYELLFTIKRDKEDELRSMAKEINGQFYVIGSISDAVKEIDYLYNGEPYEFNISGYQHFTEV